MTGGSGEGPVIAVDAAAIMAAHPGSQTDHGGVCWLCHTAWPCERYLLAEALADKTAAHDEACAEGDRVNAALAEALAESEATVRRVRALLVFEQPTRAELEAALDGAARQDVTADPDEHRLTIYASKNVTRGKAAAAAVHAALIRYGIPHGAVIVLSASPSQIERDCAIVVRDAGRTEVDPGTVTAGTSARAVPSLPSVTEGNYP